MSQELDLDWYIKSNGYTPVTSVITIDQRKLDEKPK